MDKGLDLAGLRLVSSYQIAKPTVGLDPPASPAGKGQHRCQDAVWPRFKHFGSLRKSQSRDTPSLAKFHLARRTYAENGHRPLPDPGHDQ